LSIKKSTKLRKCYGAWRGPPCPPFINTLILGKRTDRDDGDSMDALSDVNWNSSTQCSCTCMYNYYIYKYPFAISYYKVREISTTFLDTFIVEMPT